MVVQSMEWPLARVNRPSNAPLFMARISPIGCRIEHNVREREVRELVTKGQVQDFQTKIIVIGIQKSGGIFFELIEPWLPDFPRRDRSEVGEAYDVINAGKYA